MPNLATIVIDMLNPYDHKDGEELAAQVPDHVLRTHDVQAVVLAGQVTEQCILYSALDASVRGFEVRVARDAVVPLDPELGEAALTMMERNMKARVVAGGWALG